MNIITLTYFIFVLPYVLGQDEPSSNETESDSVTIMLPTLGSLEGSIKEFNGAKLQVFLGVPYATPPVGDFRFVPTVSVRPWGDDTRQAKEHGAACWQYTEGPFPWYDNETGKSEDCLFLNIWAPVATEEETKHAVMFWIHGGGYTLGSNRMDVYDGTALAKEGIIVVTANYRLGLFGYFSTGTELFDDAPGNMGTWDLVLALQWVIDNIEYFGGDKNRITIAGESGGSSIASSLCVSPKTEGMFQRAILQSASITKHKYNKFENNVKAAQTLANKVGCTFEDFHHEREAVVKCLRTKDAEELIKAQAEMYPRSTRSFQPQFGDDLLPNNAVDDIINGNFHNVSILTGILPDEGSCFIPMFFEDTFGFFGEKAVEVNASFARTMLSKVFKNFTDPDSYIDWYLKDIPEDDDKQLRQQVNVAYGDVIISCPTIYFAESLASKGNDVFFYWFSHRPSNTPWADWMGAAHYEEVQFTFGRPLRVPDEYTPEEVALSAKTVKVWANFVRDGNPGKLLEGEGEEVDWPKFSKEDPNYMDLNAVCFGYPKTGPLQENCNLLRSYYGF